MSQETEQNLLGNDSVCGIFDVLSCDVKCTALFPAFYPPLILGLKIAKDKGLLKNKGDCNAIAISAALLTEILVEAEIPGAGAIAAALAGSCGKCACEKVF